MKSAKLLFPLIFLLSLILFMSRIIPHQANVTPVLALCLMAGFLAKGRWYSLVLPLLALLASDLWIGMYPGWGFNYVSLVLIAFSGVFASYSLPAFMGFGFLGATQFFLLSNFGVWFFSKMYAPTWEGLLTCYQMGLPFFRATLVGTLGSLFVFYCVYGFFAQKQDNGMFERA